MTRPVELVAVAVLSVLVTLAEPPAVASAQNLVVDPQLLHVRATQTPDGRWHSTPLGVVRLDRTDTAVTPWRAEPTVPWLTVTPAAGAGPAGLTVHVDPARLGGAAGVGEVVISSNGAVIQRVTVRASVVSPDQPPIGVIDAPADGEVTEGPLRLFGWVLDDVGVSSIEICRAGAVTHREEPCADGKGVRVAWAELNLGDRPDVAAAFPGFDHAHPAGWTAAFTVPVTARTETATSYYALARDVAGHVALLGSRKFSVTTAVVPRVQVRGPQSVLFGAFIVFLVVHLWARRWVVPWPDLPLAVAPARRPGPGLAEAAALFAILAVFVWLALPGLTRSFDYDEMYSASQFIVGQSWWDSATRVQTLNNHFANSVLASAAVRLLGPVEWVIRLPAFTLALAAIVVTWRFSRRLSGPVAALCAAALLAVSPAFLLWGQSARGYTGLACLGWLSVDAFFRVLRTGDVRQARVHTITTVLLPLFHLFGLSFLVVEYLAFLGWSLATRRTLRPAVSVEGLRRLHRSFLIIGAATLLILLPMVRDLVADRPGSRARAIRAAAEATSAGAPAPTPTPAAAPGIPGAGVNWQGLAVDMVSSPAPIVWLVAGVLLTLGFVALPKRDAIVGVAVLAVPLFLLWLAGQTIFPRYFSYWIPMLAILLAAGIVAPLQWQRQWTSGVFRGAAVTLAVVTIAGGLFLARTFLASTPSLSAPGYREWLSRPEGWADSAVAVVGQDAFMFDFYLGKSATRVVDPAQMDRLLRRGGTLLVAYHDRPRNRPADRAVRDLLIRRCLDNRRGNIVMFTCR